MENLFEIEKIANSNYCCEVIDIITENLHNSKQKINEKLKDYHIKCTNVIKEKIDQLNYYYYVTLVSNFIEKNKEIELSIPSGIDYDNTAVYYGVFEKEEEEVFSHFEFDEDSFKVYYPNAPIKIGIDIFNSLLPDYQKMIKERNYDNYVTGGVNNKIQQHYKQKDQEFTKRGFFAKSIYK